MQLWRKERRRMIDITTVDKEGRVKTGAVIFVPKDYVQVVRCKDCKEYKYCFLLPNDDDYCSKGERKE